MWRHIRGTRTMPGKYVDGVLQRPKSADKYTETDRDKITDKLTITAVLAAPDNYLLIPDNIKNRNRRTQRLVILHAQTH